MSLHTDLIAAGLPVSGTAAEGQTVLWTRELTPQEALTAESIINPKAYRQTQAKLFAPTIPNWATWTQTQLQNWWDANLADSIVDGLAIPAPAKAVLKAQNLAILREGQMLIALRDFTNIMNGS